MSEFNDIGISRELDLPRVERLLKIGFISAVIVFIGDCLLGYGTRDPQAIGYFEAFLSAYLNVSDFRIVVAGILGLIGIPLEGLSYFGIYRLIVCKSPNMAHKYRTGIIGYIAFGACGVHVPCCAVAWIYKHIYLIDVSTAENTTLDFAKYFMLPATILFGIFTILLCVVQIKAFAQGLTPLPKRCWVFCLPVGMLAAVIPSFFGNVAWINALSTAWISVGNLWMFGGLIIHVRKIRKSGERVFRTPVR